MTTTYRSPTGTLLCAGCNQKAISEDDSYHDICEKRIVRARKVELVYAATAADIDEFEAALRQFVAGFTRLSHVGIGTGPYTAYQPGALGTFVRELDVIAGETAVTR